MKTSAILLAFLCALLPVCAADGPKAPPKPVLFTAQLKIASEKEIKENDLRTKFQERAQTRRVDIAIKLGDPKDNVLTVTLSAPSLEQARKDLRSICLPPTLALRPVHRDNDILTKDGAQTKPVKGYTLYKYERELLDGTVRKSWLLLANGAPIAEKHVKRAFADGGQSLVHIELNLGGAAAMRKMTKPMRKGVDRIAVVLDDKVMTAPVVNDVLTSNFVIEGVGNIGERRALAATLTAKMAPFQVTIHDLRPSKP